MDNNTKEHRGEEFAVPQAWYGKVLGPGPGWEKKEKKSLFSVRVPHGLPS